MGKDKPPKKKAPRIFAVTQTPKVLFSVEDWDTSVSSAGSTSSITPVTTPRVRSASATMAGEKSSICLVRRLKNTNPDKFNTMVKMHLSFLLDLPGSSLEEFLGDGCCSSTGSSSQLGGAADNKPGTGTGNERTGGLFSNFGKKKHKSKESRPARSPSPSPGTSTSNGPVFGVPLSPEVIERIYPIFEYLGTEKCLCEEGLFRKSGNFSRQRQMKEELQQGITTIDPESRSHDVASLLKMFLAEMPEPLLTEKHYQAYCQLPAMSSHKQLQTVQLLVQLLPRQNLVLLEALLALLHRVAQEPHNKMTADALGILFAPTILAPRKMIAKDLQQVSPNINQAIAFMVEHAEHVTTVPDALVTDIRQYWDDMDEAEEEAREAATNAVPRLRKRLLSEDRDTTAITTTVTFADRAASQQAAASSDTETALAQLYAHVSSMPESAKKRKLLKQFTKASQGGTLYAPSTPTAGSKHKRSRSFGDSIKKMVAHRRRGSQHGTAVGEVAEKVASAPAPVAAPQSPCPAVSTTNPTVPVIMQRPPLSTPLRTPVQKRFADRLRAADPSATSLDSPLPRSPRVHIVDLHHQRASPSSARQRRRQVTPSTTSTTAATDSPLCSAAATQTSLTMLADFLNTPTSTKPRSASSLSSRVADSNSSSSCNTEAADKENSAPSPARPHHKIAASLSPGPRGCSSMFSSPISQSVTKAPKSIQVQKHLQQQQQHCFTLELITTPEFLI